MRVLPEEQCARSMDLMKCLTMGLGEVRLAMREAFSDLSDEQFQAYAVEGRHNIVTLVMHCLQQLDEFNGHLQAKRQIPARHGWQFLEHELRFHLWNVPKEQLPKAGDPFPSVAEVTAWYDEIHAALAANLEAIGPEGLVSEGVGQWPQLTDPFFRAIWHQNAHIRQIWLIRGHLGLSAPWPQQHYA